MATFRGRDGVVEVGSDAVLALQSWSLNLTAGTVESDSMGDTWMTRKADIRDATGDFTYFDDDTASGNGQAALTPGATVTLRLYGRGKASGRLYHTGSGIVTSVSKSAAKGDMVSVTCGWEGTGVWTTAEEPA